MEILDEQLLIAKKKRVAQRSVPTYEEMVRTLYNQTHDRTSHKKQKLPTPEMQKMGPKKTMWTNFSLFYDSLNRTAQHMSAFFLAELAIEGNLDGKRLLLSGKFLPKQIEALVRKYIGEYVLCSLCRSTNTILDRDITTRLYFIHCENCTSKRSVTAIKTGYRAISKNERRAARA